jgi:hypothetical protein
MGDITGGQTEGVCVCMNVEMKGRAEVLRAILGLKGSK